MPETERFSRPIRLIALDVDGTLVGSDERVSPAAQQAIMAAREQGCEVVLCTGRTRHTAQPICEQLNLSGYLIASNGAVVMHLETREVLRRRLLPIPTALRIVQAILDADAAPFVYECATGEGVEAARVLHHPDRPGGTWAVRPRYRPYPRLREELPFSPVSINAYGPAARTRALANHLAERLPEPVSIVQSGTEREWGVEVFTDGVNKQTGLAALAAHLGIEREEILAIGDHINDLEMLSWAGIGVAMGNAIPEALAVADWVTAPLHQEGVALALERFALK
jgi:HAD superfamily hydrolase (TIGR01484 family)